MNAFEIGRACLANLRELSKVLHQPTECDISLLYFISQAMQEREDFMSFEGLSLVKCYLGTTMTLFLMFFVYVL